MSSDGIHATHLHMLGSKRLKGGIVIAQGNTTRIFFLMLKIYMDHLLYEYCHGINIYRKTTYQGEITIKILEISIFTCT